MATVQSNDGDAVFRDYHHDFSHVQDPNERRRLALAEVDRAPFGWYHVRAIFVAGCGFFTDSYDIFCVSLLTTMLGIVYFGGSMPTSSDTAVKLATSAGTVVGQLFFGWLADLIGRKRMYGIELMIIIISTLAMALTSNSPSMDIIGVIIFWRVIQGIGIGGDYPLSSIITSEFATTKWRGAMMAAVFSAQGFGQLAGGIVFIILVAGFKTQLSTSTKFSNCTGECAVAVDKMWRTLIGMGAVPGLIALYFRLTIPETPRYTFDVARDVERADLDVKAYMTGRHESRPDEATRIAAQKVAAENMTVEKAGWGDFFRHYSKPRNGMLLAGTMLSWCFLDIAYYGVSLNNATFLTAIGYSTANAKTTYEILYNTGVGNLVIVLAGSIPGYWFTVATVDIVGRKPIQFCGFAILTVLFIVMGFDYDNLVANGGKGMLAVYVLAQIFFNWGPNSTTFIVPGECFPTRYRSTSHGLSAAAGKIGSIIGQGAIAPLRTTGATGSNTAPWMNHVLEIYAFFMLCGCFSTLLIKETKGKTLEELSMEDDYAARAVAPVAAERGGEAAVPVADKKTLAGSV